LELLGSFKPASFIIQQQVLSMSSWGGNGLYLLHLINPQGHITEVKKIVLAP
jgi:hemolysin-activating ACP:hemolysin acyltransferase